MSSVYEDLADLYLRLNGYFTVKNFFQHPALAPPVGETDIDVLAVRFPYEREITGREPSRLPHDGAILDCDPQEIHFVVAEVKREPAAFNTKWFDDAEVLKYTLRRAGFTDSDNLVEETARRLRATGRAVVHQPLRCRFQLTLFSDYEGALPYPEYDGPPLEAAKVINWQEVLGFLHKRYTLMTGTRVKRGQGPLRDMLFGFLYHNLFLTNNLTPEFLRLLSKPVCPYRMPRDKH